MSEIVTVKLSSAVSSSLTVNTPTVSPDDVLSSVKLFDVVCVIVGASFCNETVGV